MDDTIPPEIRTAILDFCKNPEVSSTTSPSQPITYLSPKQVAVTMAVSLRSVQYWLASGQLKSKRIANFRRVPSNALDEFIQSHSTSGNIGRSCTTVVNHQQDGLDKAS